MGSYGHKGHRQNRPQIKRVRRKAPAIDYAECAFADKEIQAIRRAIELDADWDVILVGDGSVSNETKTCGWAVTMFDRKHGTKRLFYGAASSGTCLLVELMPYMQALLWYARVRGRKLSKARTVKVAVLTDSEIIARQGQDIKRFLDDPKRIQATRPLWLVLEQLSATGYDIRWHWVRRGTLAANKEMNQLAQSVRWKMEKVKE
jgi:ribonuclease HI